jgi:hypothetical protein
VATSDGALGKAGDGDARIALTGTGAVTATALASGGNAAVRSNTNPAAGVAGAAAPHGHAAGRERDIRRTHDIHISGGKSDSEHRVPFVGWSRKIFAQGGPLHPIA